ELPARRPPACRHRTLCTGAARRAAGRAHRENGGGDPTATALERGPSGTLPERAAHTASRATAPPARGVARSRRRTGGRLCSVTPGDDAARRRGVAIAVAGRAWPRAGRFHPRTDPSHPRLRSG